MWPDRALPLFIFYFLAALYSLGFPVNTLKGQCGQMAFSQNTRQLSLAVIWHNLSPPYSAENWNQQKLSGDTTSPALMSRISKVQKPAMHCIVIKLAHFVFYFETLTYAWLQCSLCGDQKIGSQVSVSLTSWLSVFASVYTTRCRCLTTPHWVLCHWDEC